MNKKGNPWVSLAALVLLGIILVAVCSSCRGEYVTAAEPEPPRFEVTYYHNSELEYRVITDTETGVQYLLIGDSTGYGIGYGLTVLQPGNAETGANG